MFIFIQQNGPDGRPMTRLMTESGPMRGRIFRLDPPHATVGSADDNTIVVPAPYVDAHHFSIDLQGPQAILRAHDGATYVDDQLVSEVALGHGARIRPEPMQDESTLQNTPGSAATQKPEERAIVLAQREVAPVLDDVKTMFGDPSARWGGRKKPPPRPKLSSPPGSPAHAVIQPTGSQQRKLEVLLAVGKALSRPEEIEAKVDRVLELLFDTMDIDRAAILVLPADADAATTSVGEQDTFTWSAYRDRQGPTSPMKLSSTIIEKVLQESVAVMTQDAQAEDWLDGARSVLGQAIRTCICTPLKTSSGTLGVLYADSSRTSSPFNQDDLEFFTAFSNQAAVSIENVRLLHVALEKERLEQDLRVARQIQRFLYPRKVPALPGFSLAGESIAMDDVGGDYFDYIPLDEHRIALVVADVSGHGVSAALIMTMTRSILQATLQPTSEPGPALLRVNQLISADMITRMFVTMLLLILDTRDGSYTFANAGHTAPLQFHQQIGATLEVDGGKGGPIGMSRWARLRPKYPTNAGQLAPGDLLCLYTDGFPEAPNPAGELMDDVRFQQSVTYAAQRHYEAAHITQEIYQALHNWRGESPITDDTTAIILKRNA